MTFIGNANANETKVSDVNAETTFESCVSIASEIANGDSAIFRAAYVGCINGRINQN